MLFTQGYPGYARGVAAAGPGEFVVATAMGVIARYWPAQQKSEVIISGLDHQLYGVALTARGGVVVAEQGTGRILAVADGKSEVLRSEEHTSELQSLMRISYAVFCLKK